jgi:phosphatidylserine/phosphatidylglycerophosphate/cardiolipin synthase-like enzyme
VGDLDFTFRERWEDPTPLNYSNVLRAWLTPRRRSTKPLPDALPEPPPAGSHAVQVLRTYPARRPPYPFAPQGERSIARAYAKAFPRARRLIYIEDQFFWSTEVVGLLAETLKRNLDLHVIAVVPRHPDKDGRISGPPNRIGQQQAMALIDAAGGDRVAFYDLENEAGAPIYVHAKVCVIDDVWVSVGSDNLNRRSWTHDSEIACAVIDARLDDRTPADPAGLGDGARRFARDLRLQLWAEHLGTSPANPDLLDPVRGFAVWRQTATALDGWYDADKRGTRPPGQARPHHLAPIGAHNRWWADLIYRTVYDPDGRPKQLRRTHGF